MTKRRERAARGVWWVLIVLAVAGLAVAQEPAEPDDPKDAELLRKMEAEQEDVITGRHFSYDPAGRRDPFEPLIRTTPVSKAGMRPKGIAGMLVNEIDLKGVSTDVRGNPLAFFRGSDNKGYTLRVGDVVYDGRILSINLSRGIVVFRQNVDDPRRIKPYRDVLKKLYPSDETAEEEEG